MITLEQLDELESRIVKALELIGDLRTENSRLEMENQKLRNEYETLKTTLDQKERDVRELKQQLDKANEELNELKQKESILEKRISEILNKLSLSEGQNYQKKEFSSKIENGKSFASTDQEFKPIISNGDLTIVEEDTSKTDDENFVEIEVEEPIKKPKEEVDLVQTATTQSPEQVEKPTPNDEEIIILDEDEDEIVLADQSEEVIFESAHEDFKEELEEAKKVEQSEVVMNKEKDAILEEELILDDDIGVFELEDDEDFLIIEENEDERDK